jgi:rhodanese-related sulfurtransferase
MEGVEFYNPPFCRFVSTSPDRLVKFIQEYWYLFVTAFASGGLLLWPVLSRSVGAAIKVSPSEAVMLINREKAVLIDVSEPAEFAAAHAAGSKNVPIGGLEASPALPRNKALPLVVLCPTGARASRAVAILRKLGYENARALAGGVAAWREANLPIEKSA